MRKYLLGLAACLSLFVLGIVLYYIHIKPINNRKTNPLIKLALTKFIPKSGTAIDFGSGSGYETTYLLKHGYKVIAIDNELQDLKLLQKKNSTYRNKLTVYHINFEEINWATLPQVNLFLALSSLVFINREEFPGVWNNIVNQIKPDGYFVGDIFTYVIIRSNVVPLVPKETIPSLFKEFTILYFEPKSKLNDVKGSMQPPRVYSIIARKKAS